MDIRQLLETIIADGTVATLALNPQAQFGRRGRRYIGAELLPEQLREENAYREMGVEYVTVLANDGTRYSPVQIKDGKRIGSMLVELGEIDIGAEFTSADYDALIKLLGRGRDQEAMAAFTDWFDKTVNLGLREKMEYQRWQAIADAQVLRKTDNATLDPVSYSNPSGHRITVASGSVGSPAGWYLSTYDPFDDIYTQANLLKSKGYTVSRIITSTRILSILQKNPKVATRANRVTVVAGGSAGAQFSVASGRVSQEAISAMLAEDGLPPIETYDLQARTDSGTVRFLRDTAFVMVATTGRDTDIDLGDSQPILLQNTLGYQGIGRAAGQGDPGVVLQAEFKTSKPPRIEGEGWATTLPVILNPEAIAVINIPAQS